MSAEKMTANEETIIAPWRANPHPDGQPWPKCCGNKGDDSCLCFTRKPKNNPSRLDQILTSTLPFQMAHSQSVVQSTLDNGERFFCMHRQDGKFHRECAGWAKLKGSK